MLAVDEAEFEATGLIPAALIPGCPRPDSTLSASSLGGSGRFPAPAELSRRKVRKLRTVRWISSLRNRTLRVCPSSRRVGRSPRSAKPQTRSPLGGGALASNSAGGLLQATSRDRLIRQPSSDTSANRRRRRLLVALVISVFAWAVIAAPTAQAGEFGFSYWPYCMSTNALGNSDLSDDPIPASATEDDWDVNQQTIEKDLDQIASLGGGIVRLLIWPQQKRSVITKNGTSFSCITPDTAETEGVTWSGPTHWHAWRLKGQNQGGEFTSEFDAQTRNVDDLIELVDERGLKAIVTFGNLYMKRCVSGNKPCIRGDTMLWKNAYGPKTADPNDVDGWDRFRQDAVTWVNGYINPIEACTCSDAVIAYDYHTESSQVAPVEIPANEPGGPEPGVWEYVNYLYDNSNVPAGKRLVSPQLVDPTRFPPRHPADQTVPPTKAPVDDGVPPAANDGQFLAYRLGSSRQLNYVEFHSYPNSNNQDVAATYDYLNTNGFSHDPFGFHWGHFNASVILGEFGEETPAEEGNAGEDQQETVVRSYLLAARDKAIPYYIHWQLWDSTPTGNAQEQTFGFGYSPHSPKDVLGGVAVDLKENTGVQLVANADMELRDPDAEPSNWSPDGNAPGAITLRRFGQTGIGLGATNDYYARLRADPPQPGAPTDPLPRVWMDSDVSTIPGAPQPGRKLFANAYIRSNMDKVRLTITEYNDAGVVQAKTGGPIFEPVQGAWNNYLHQVGSWNVTLQQGTTRVRVSVSATPAGATPFLDVDTVTAAVQ